MRPSEEYMYSHPDEWIHWPYLPVIRRGPNGTELGVFKEGGFFTKSNLLLVGQDKTIWEPKTPAELIAEGWIVD